MRLALLKTKGIIISLIIIAAAFCIFLAGLYHSRVPAYKKYKDLSEITDPSLRKVWEYEKIILSTAGIQDKKFPLRRRISDKSTEKISFMDPGRLKEGTKTLIIVPGDRPLDNITPTVDMVYRVLKAIELYKQYPGSILMMSGGPTAGDIPEARMMALIAWSRGVDPKRIILEDKSRITEQNAEFTSNVVKGKNIGQIFLVSGPFHLQRAVPIFQNYYREFKDIKGVECGVSPDIIISQMEQYLNTNNNRAVRKRLESIKNRAGSISYDHRQRMWEYGKVISNSSTILSDGFPLRSRISEDELWKTDFLSPEKAPPGIKTAIFVLPNRPLDEVTPSIDSIYRALKAVELSRKFPEAVIVMLGPRTVGDISEARMMALVAWSRGADPSKIIVEDRARSIGDKAEFIAEMVKSKNIENIFIVSKDAHLKRFMPFFQKYKEFKSVEGVDCGVTKNMIIGQMEQYLRLNDDRIVLRRLNNVKNGRIGID